jgi:glycolate oxidase iron-sulfur subunit
MELHVDEDQLASCVSCGLCLPHCPTFRVSGEERYSPRGRIEAMRQVHLGGRPADASFLDVVDTCVQCRGCETACPSAVPFGRLMEATRETLAAEAGYQPRWRRLALGGLGHHRLVLAGSTLLPPPSGPDSYRPAWPGGSACRPGCRCAAPGCGPPGRARAPTTCGCSPVA